MTGNTSVSADYPLQVCCPVCSWVNDRQARNIAQGVYSLVWPIRECATGQGMVFVLSVLNRVNNFVRVCPNYKQGIVC